MFILYANKNMLILRKREPMTSGSVNAYEVRFEFSPDWEDLTKTVVFKAGSESRSILLDESGECVIPWEVLTKPNVALRAGVYGTRGGELVLPTVWENLGVIQEGTEPGESSKPSTPSVYEQIVDLAAKAEATAQSVREDADAGKFDGPPGPQGEPGKQGPPGPAGKDGQDGEQGKQGPPGTDGSNGKDGATFTPSVSEAGTLTWTNDGGLPNPEPADIIGPPGKKGDTGPTGATPELTIGEVTTLPPGQSATATMTGTPENPFLSLGIPQGAPGEQTVLDQTLSQAGAAAEAKAVGDALGSPAHSVTDTLGPAAEVSTDIAAAGSLLRPVSEIKLVQEGEGTPSLTNIRNITGWDSITLTHNSETETQVLPETVYGGSYDWATGVLTVTHKLIQLPVSEMAVGSGYPQWKVDPSETTDLLVLKNRPGFTPHWPADVASESAESVYLNRNGVFNFNGDSSIGLNQTELKAQYPDHVFRFVFELAEARTIQLTPRQFLAISGVNTLSSDCGGTAVTFTADLKKYIDMKLAELAGGEQDEA